MPELMEEVSDAGAEPFHRACASFGLSLMRTPDWMQSSALASMILNFLTRGEETPQTRWAAFKARVEQGLTIAGYPLQ